MANIDCTTARTLLAFRRPGELPAEETASLSAHLASCPSCAAAVASQDAFDAAVGKAMVSVPVPDGLADRLLKKGLAKRRIATTRKVGQVLGTAATILIAFGIIFGVFWSLRPTFHVEDLTMRESIALEDPERSVREWLKAEKLPGDLPLDFDFRNHVFHGKELVYGREVPVIVFQTWLPGQQRPDRAKLYLVSSEQFNLRALQDGQSSFFNGMVIRPSETHPSVRYLVLFTTPSLAPFQNPPRQQL